jgi:hypothetical protein
MTPKDILTIAVDPALTLLATHGVKSDDRARVELMAIAGQESAWQYRQQVGGPAHSFWQFEKGGGVAGVLGHPASRDKIKAVCADLGVPCDAESVYQAMIDNDVLAACMARLLLFTDPAPLPNVGEVQAGWDYYERNWRPGAPHPEAWPGRYGTAMGLVNQANGA